MIEDFKEFAIQYFLKNVENNASIPRIFSNFQNGLTDIIKRAIREVRPYQDLYKRKPLIVMNYANMIELEKEAYGTTILGYYDKNSLKQRKSIYGCDIISLNMDDDKIFLIDMNSIYNYEIKQFNCNMTIHHSIIGEDK